MTMLPLLAVDSLHAQIVVHRGHYVLAAEFVAAALRISERMSARHVVNLCENRYCFLLGLVAACLRDQLTLLPPNQTADTLQELAEHYPDQQVIDDAIVEQWLNGSSLQAASELPDWRIASDRVVALTFTSGSTGKPQAHAKTWRTLSRNAQLVADEVLGGAGAQIVATVPAQHVYGLETSAITALAAGCAVFDGKPFFPQDVLIALESMREPRTLVTTPTHLRALLESRVTLPTLQRIVSATAPLSVELAERAEAAWNTTVHEIYGCTEAGIMANRRTVEQKPWRTFTDGRMTLRSDAAEYSAPQLPTPITLQDIIESLSPTEFHLRGRAADMIKVAGKRASLQALTQHLLSIGGVQDAAIFLLDASESRNARPAAIAVAPGHTAQDILIALSTRIDAVFLPRPLILLEKLPRNAVGKLPHDVLLAVLRDHRGSAR
jgi:acyl-coenzyme A synthetase/AMP-(fatty) acid ligase